MVISSEILGHEVERRDDSGLRLPQYLGLIQDLLSPQPTEPLNEDKACQDAYRFGSIYC
jgi:hypothetical protein